MIFDDHDVHDDWNISWSWVDEMRAKPWWEARITGAFMAYWVYQHIGNLSPPELAEETMLAARQGDDDAGPRAPRGSPAGGIASRRRAAGRTTAISATRGCSSLDSRAARVLAEGRRQMIDEEEWDWIVDHSSGAFDHLIVASTLPIFIAIGVHHLQAWNEALCAGSWGRLQPT